MSTKYFDALKLAIMNNANKNKNMVQTFLLTKMKIMDADIFIIGTE